MAKSLKDQLKEWKEHKRDVEDELRDLEKDARRARVLADEARREAVEEREADGAPAVEDDDEELSDEDLFRRAVEGMRSGSDAILKKYDKTDLPPSERGGVGPAAARKDVSDQALFLQAVGDMRREDVERMKPSPAPKKPADARFARRVQKGEVQPQNVLDLHGDDRVRALERTRVFLDAEARARTEVVLVVHGKGAGVLASEVVRLLDEHPLVVEHLAAPRELGGDGARVVRLRARRV